MCSPLWYTPNSHRRVHAHSSTHVALAHTHEHRRAYIRCSSRTPCSVEYTQHIGPAPTRVTIAFTRRPTMAVLKCRKSQIGRPNMCASIRVTGDPKVGKLLCLRRRAIALPHSRRLCAAAASLPPPLLDARKSVPSTARANMCREHSPCRDRADDVTGESGGPSGCCRLPCQGAIRPGPRRRRL